MRKVTVDGTEFTLLEPDEIDCEHGEWRPVYEDVVINPDDEFVQGYGSMPVTARVEVGQRCTFCGYIRRAEK